MTRHPPYWARIERLGSEHIFGVYVVTFDTWHSAILFDWVQGIMLASQGKVLSPGNEGSKAVIVYVSIFPQLCFICVHMPISGLSSLVQFLYMRHRKATGVLNGSPQSGFGFGLWIGLLLYLWDLDAVQG